MVVRVSLWLTLLVGSGWATWEGVRPGSRSGKERLARIGLPLTVMGVILTVFAWWMLIPELILLAGIVLLLTNRRSEKRMRIALGSSDYPTSRS